MAPNRLPTSVPMLSLRNWTPLCVSRAEPAFSIFFALSKPPGRGVMPEQEEQPLPLEQPIRKSANAVARCLANAGTRGLARDIR